MSTASKSKVFFAIYQMIGSLANLLPGTVHGVVASSGMLFLGESRVDAWRRQKETTAAGIVPSADAGFCLTSSLRSRHQLDKAGPRAPRRR